MIKASMSMVKFFHAAVVSLVVLAACGGLGTHRIPRVGIAGHYQEGKEQFLRGRGGNMDWAVSSLEKVVAQDPSYRDSLTLLSRAYYKQGRYQDAYLILQRALTLNKEDEIAWLVLGLTQFRLGQDEKGLESLKGGITLMSKVSKEGYRGYLDWDSKRQVSTALRRSVILATKGLEEKPNLLQTVESLLTRIDEEENFQRVDSKVQERRGQGS